MAILLEVINVGLFAVSFAMIVIVFLWYLPTLFGLLLAHQRAVSKGHPKIVGFPRSYWDLRQMLEGMTSQEFWKAGDQETRRRAKQLTIGFRVFKWVFAVSVALFLLLVIITPR